MIDKLQVEPLFRFDTDIAQDVKRRLLNSSVIDSQGISVSCEGGKVSLWGKVASWAEKEDANVIATEVRGVKDVDNRLTVNFKNKRSDQEIKNDVVASLERDVYLVGYPITVKVHKGKVILDGKVGNAFEWDRADDTARWIDNVKQVENNLVVSWWLERDVRSGIPTVDSANLKRAVVDEINQDSRLDASKIRVSAEFGTVSLEGEVDDHYQKKVASQDATNVVGVAWVDNDLFVRTDRRSDPAILDDVTFALASDSVLGSDDFIVKVKDGAVTLNGTTPTWYDRMHAEDVASRVRGVRKVINRVEVNWRAPKSDQAIAKAIGKRIESDWLTHAVSDKIKVHVNNGVATLEGKVEFWSQRQEAEDLAFRSDGVWMVKNKLGVKGYDYAWSQRARSEIGKSEPLSLFDDWTSRYDRFWW